MSHAAGFLLRTDTLINTRFTSSRPGWLRRDRYCIPFEGLGRITAVRETNDQSLLDGGHFVWHPKSSAAAL